MKAPHYNLNSITNTQWAFNSNNQRNVTFTIIAIFVRDAGTVRYYKFSKHNILNTEPLTFTTLSDRDPTDVSRIQLKKELSMQAHCNPRVLNKGKIIKLYWNKIWEREKSEGEEGTRISYQWWKDDFP